jgi:hypothetical protein
MFLPMMGFFFTLVVLGGIASLAVTIDPYAARRAPFSYAFFFAGVTAIVFVILGGFASVYINDTVGGLIAFMLAPTLGLLSGAILGYRLGLIRRRHAPEDDA